MPLTEQYISENICQRISEIWIRCLQWKTTLIAVYSNKTKMCLNKDLIPFLAHIDDHEEWLCKADSDHFLWKEYWCNAFYIQQHQSRCCSLLSAVTESPHQKLQMHIKELTEVVITEFDKLLHYSLNSNENTVTMWGCLTLKQRFLCHQFLCTTTTLLKSWTLTGSLDANG